MNDNLVHRALFSLPPIQLSDQTGLAVPELPLQRIVTDHREVDAVIWLRSIIGTGQPALIAKAKEAAALIKTPLNELEKRYSTFLARTNGGHMFATFGAIGFADLDGWETKSIKLAARRHEAHARFGDMLFANTAAENFCEETLAGVNAGRDEWELNKEEVDARFDEKTDQCPATLSDCLAELKYWADLYWLRNSIDRDGSEGGVQAQARKDYAFRCLGRILPRSTEEAHRVLQYLIDDNAMSWKESHGILMNLMTQQAGTDTPRGIDGCMSTTAGDADHPSSRETASMEMLEPAAPASDDAGLQQWRDKLDPDLLRLRAQLLTPVMPPTGQDIVDVLEQLDALATAGGLANVCEFAIEIINGLMSIVDVDQLA